MIFDLVHAGIEPDLLEGLVKLLPRGTWGEPSDVFAALQLEPSRRDAIAKALDYCPREHGPLDDNILAFIRAAAHGARERARTPEFVAATRKDQEALEKLGACQPGINFVSYCGGIENAWTYFDALGHSDYKKWLRVTLDQAPRDSRPAPNARLP
jgi:hypothetical protein